MLVDWLAVMGGGLGYADAGAELFGAVDAGFGDGLRTADIWSEGTRKVGTREMRGAVVAAITKPTIKS
jgi:3-isopropylmalate dehydrogenase